VPISFDASPARATAALIAVAPSATAGTSLNEPPNAPIAVRTGSAITMERDVVMRAPFHYRVATR
jgi:hypothetical protein